MSDNDLIRRKDAVAAFIRLSQGAMEGVIYKRTIDAIPAVDAVDVRHSGWEETTIFPAEGNVDMLQSAFCPECKKYHTTPYSYYITKYEYCPNCGAKMDGKRREEAEDAAD